MTVREASPLNEIITAQTDPDTGAIEARATFRASPERLFRALTTDEVCEWWVRPGVFDTREWSGDVTEGGRWAAAGVGGGQPYQLAGEFTEIDRPHRLVHTWRAVGAPFGPALVTYDLAPRGEEVELILRHSGLPNDDVREKTRAGWETSLRRLRKIVAVESEAETQEPGTP